MNCSNIIKYNKCNKNKKNIIKKFRNSLKDRDSQFAHYHIRLLRSDKIYKYTRPEKIM